ncbi:MAG: CDP-alcohol phosphatidyltransferase family protein [Gemmatimonadaceae bacterium]
MLRRLKDRVMAPVARWLGPALSPNAVTVLAFLLGIAAAGAVYARHDALALVLWFANRVLDGLDGTLARVHGRQTDFGGYLDIVLDFCVYAAIPAAIVLASDSRPLAIAGFVLLASFYVNAASWMYLAAILERRGRGASERGELTTVPMPAGLVAGAETIVLYAALLVMEQWRVEVFLLMAALVGVTIVQRMAWARRQLQ